MMRSYVLALIVYACSVVVAAETKQQGTTVWIIIVNGNSGVSSLNQKQVMGLFLGRTKFLPSGQKVIAYDYPGDSIMRSDFYYALTGKNIAEIDAYWARLKYSGRASPPKMVNDTEGILEKVKKQKGAIAYVPLEYEAILEEYRLIKVHTLH